MAKLNFGGVEENVKNEFLNQQEEVFSM